MFVVIRRALVAAFLVTLIAVAPAKAATEVKIALAVPDSMYLTVYVAQDRGFYKAEGLDSQIVQFDNDNAAAQALTANAVTISCGSIFPVIDSYIQGRDLMAIWAEINFPSYTWYGPSKYNSIKDVKGGKIGISSMGALSQQLSAWAVDKAGLDAKKDVTFIPLGGPLNRVAGLQAGQVDLIPASPPGTYLLSEEGFKPLMKLTDYMSEFSMETFYVRKSNIDRDQEVLKSIIRGTVKAKAWAMQHRDETVSILMEHLGGKTEQRAIYAKTVDEALPYFPEDGHFPVDSINVFLGFFKDQGKLKEIPPISAFSDSRFIDFFKKNPIN